MSRELYEAASHAAQNGVPRHSKVNEKTQADHHAARSRGHRARENLHESTPKSPSWNGPVWANQNPKDAQTKTTFKTAIHISEDYCTVQSSFTPNGRETNAEVDHGTPHPENYQDHNARIASREPRMPKCIINCNALRWILMKQCAKKIHCIFRERLMFA